MQSANKASDRAMAPVHAGQLVLLGAVSRCDVNQWAFRRQYLSVDRPPLAAVAHPG